MSSRAWSGMRAERWTLAQGPFRAADLERLPARDWTLAGSGRQSPRRRGRRLAAPLRVHPVRAPRRCDGELRGSRRRCRPACRLLRRVPAAGRRASALATQSSTGSAVNAIEALDPITAGQDPDPVSTRGGIHARRRRHALSASGIRPRWGRGGRMHDLFDRLPRSVRAGARNRISRLDARLDRARGPLRRSLARAHDEPARIDRSMQKRCSAMLAGIRWSDAVVSRFLGCYLSEPKPNVFFEPPSRPLGLAAFRSAAARRGVSLDRRTQLLYDSSQCVSQRRGGRFRRSRQRP